MVRRELDEPRANAKGVVGSDIRGLIRGICRTRRSAHKRRQAGQLKEPASINPHLGPPMPPALVVIQPIRATLVLSEGLRPSDSPTRSLARRFDGALRSRGSLAMLARTVERASGF